MANRKKTKPRKDGRYQRQVYLGTRPDGSRIIIPVYGKTDDEAEDKKNLLKLKLGKGIDVKGGVQAFSVWAFMFLQTIEFDVAEKTYENYTDCVNHLNRYLGDVSITDLRPYHFRMVLNTLYKCNPNNGKPASKKLLNDIRTIAFRIMNFAVENRAIEINPVAGVKTPKNAPVKKRLPLSRDEIRWIMSTPHRMQIAAMIMTYAGLRRGELVPLTWPDINLKKKCIEINKAVKFVHNRPVLKSPKTEAGERIVYIPDILVDFLKVAKAEIFKDALSSPHSKCASLYVCPNPEGDMMTEQAWRTAWNSYQSELGFKFGTVYSKSLNEYIVRVGRENIKRFDPHGTPKLANRFTAHQLRHTYATIMYFSGVDLLTAKEQFGHKDIKLLLDTYTHLDKIHKGRSIKKLDEYCTTFQIQKRAV